MAVTAELIARARLLIHDPVSADQVFDDQTVQDTLDAHQYDVDAYDVYAAAADLLEMWAARVALEFDFESDGQGFKRSQQQPALLALAAQYRRRQRPTVVAMVRADVA